jgi:hypothetical protein
MQGPLNVELHTALTLQMSGAIPLLPLHAQGHLYFYLYSDEHEK